MNKILIVSDSEAGTSTLSSFIEKLDFDYEILISGSTEVVLPKIKSASFSLVIVFEKDEICTALRKKSDIDILLISDKKSLKEKSEQLSEMGIFSLVSPFETWELVQAVNFIKATHSRFDSLKKEKDGLVKKVEDMKIIDRAKCCLIHYLRISEATAHRHIEKQAMDMRLTKRQVAEEILKKYEA